MSGARADRVIDDLLDPADLLVVDDRPERDLVEVRVADRQVAGPLGQRLEVLLGDRLVDEMPARGDADLSGVQERAPGAGR
jgi:hypothetical protein